MCSKMSKELIGLKADVDIVSLDSHFKEYYVENCDVPFFFLEDVLQKTGLFLKDVKYSNEGVKYSTVFSGDEPVGIMMSTGSAVIVKVYSKNSNIYVFGDEGTGENFTFYPLFDSKLKSNKIAEVLGLTDDTADKIVSLYKLLSRYD